MARYNGIYKKPLLIRLAHFVWDILALLGLLTLLSNADELTTAARHAYYYVYDIITIFIKGS